jgi:hypothetical protein
VLGILRPISNYVSFIVKGVVKASSGSRTLSRVEFVSDPGVNLVTGERLSPEA